QRGAQLVGEGGEELVLEDAGLLGLHPQRLLAGEMLRALLLQPPAFRHVAGEDADPLAPAERDEVAGRLDQHLAPVAAPVAPLPDVVPPRARSRPEGAPALARAVDLQLPHVSGEQALARIAGQARRRRVGVDDAAL